MILTYYCAVSMILIAYLLGSVPNAVWIGKKYYGIDIREHGSRNAGTTNMLRVLGRRAALPVFVLDVLKGFVAVALLGLLKYDDNISVVWLINLKIIAVFAAVLGHIFPVFAHFKGGKGVATLVGAVLGIHPITVLLCFGVWFVVLMITHYVSLASMIGGCCFPIFVLLSPKINHSVPLIIFSFVIAGLLSGGRCDPKGKAAPKRHRTTKRSRMPQTETKPPPRRGRNPQRHKKKLRNFRHPPTPRPCCKRI